jgi:hypothetical protein
MQYGRGGLLPVSAERGQGMAAKARELIAQIEQAMEGLDDPGEQVWADLEELEAIVPHLNSKSQDITDMQNFCILKLRVLRRHRPSEIIPFFEEAVQYFKDSNARYRNTGEFYYAGAAEYLHQKNYDRSINLAGIGVDSCLTSFQEHMRNKGETLLFQAKLTVSLYLVLAKSYY